MKVTKETAKSNTFCGPAALSAITGKTVDHCVKVLQECGTRKDWTRVRGVANFEMERALGVMGFEAMELPDIEPHYCYGAVHHGARNWPTFKQWLRQTREHRKDGIYLISLAHHFIVIKGRKVWDNEFPNGRPLAKFMTRCRVTAAFRIRQRRHKLLGKPVRFWDNGWRHGKLVEVVNGWAHVEGINGRIHQVDSGDVREEI